MVSSCRNNGTISQELRYPFTGTVVQFWQESSDVLRIASELMLEKVEELPIAVDADINNFIDLLDQEPFDQNSLKRYGLRNEAVVELLKQIFG